jgi:predicted metal-dependent hydrolase
VQGRQPRIQQHQNRLMAVVRDKNRDNAALLKQLLINWYQQQASRILTDKTLHYARIIGVTPRTIVVKTFKARWGSCSSRHDIQYNWKLMMATEAVIDYVVIHELCHILHHNHSAQFWQAVARYLPDYQQCRNWLKLHGQELTI